MNRVVYGTAVGSFRNCNLGPNPNFIIECDFDNWIFNLTVSQPVHNQVIYCSKQTSQSENTVSTAVRVQGNQLVLVHLNTRFQLLNIHIINVSQV